MFPHRQVSNCYFVLRSGKQQGRVFTLHLCAFQAHLRGSFFHPIFCYTLSRPPSMPSHPGKHSGSTGWINNGAKVEHDSPRSALFLGRWHREIHGRTVSIKTLPPCTHAHARTCNVHTNARPHAYSLWITEMMRWDEGTWDGWGR